MTKRFLILPLLIPLMAIGAEGFGQVAVTANVVDPNGVPYANGSARATLVDANGIDLTNVIVNVNGASIALPAQSKGLSSTGAMNFTLYPNTQISYTSATSWKFSICSPPSAGGINPPQTCFSSTVSISGATDISATLKSASVALVGTLSGGLKFPDGTIQYTANNSGTVSGQASGVIPLPSAANAITLQSHLDDGMTKAGTLTGSENLNAPTFIGSAQPLLDIRNPAFAGGAVCNGSTDIGAALQAAVTALPSGGGEILIPGSPNVCYWANPGSFTWGSHTGPITIYVQGNLYTGTSLTVPSGVQVNFIGRSAGPYSQFQGAGPAASIALSPTGGNPIGTLGTAVVTTSSPTTFTPSTMLGIFPNAALTVVDIISCTPTSAVRASNVVTATFPSSCHIPGGAEITVAGMTDSSFNGTFQSGRADYGLNTLTWNQTGSGASTSGGTVAGTNEDTIDTIQITSTTSTTATATFNKLHTSAAQWGVVAVNIQNNSVSTRLENISVQGYYGTALVMYTYLSRLRNVGVTATGGCSARPYNFPMELQSASYIYFDGVSLVGGCQPWAILMNNLGFGGGGQYASGPLYIDNSFLNFGIKASGGSGNVSIRNSTIEQPTQGVIIADPTNYVSTGGTGLQHFELSNIGFQDLVANPNPCFVYFEYATTVFNAASDTEIKHSTTGSCLVNDYFTGQIKTDTLGNYDLTSSRGVIGVVANGQLIESEVRGGQAGLSPNVIPYQTLAVPQTPASWTGACTPTSSILAPDGSTTAGSLTGTTNSNTVFTWSGTPAVGDVFLYGGWVYSPTHGVTATAGQSAFGIDNSASVHFSFNSGGSNNTNQFDASIIDDWWHPLAGIATVTTADGTAGSVRLFMRCNSAQTTDYWKPWMMYVPASAGVSAAETARWRSQLMHGAVPANWNHPGVASTTLPIAVPSITPQVVYSAAGTALPSCTSGLNGTIATVSDATAPTYRGSYTSGGTVTTTVQCDGASTTWLTH